MSAIIVVKGSSPRLACTAEADSMIIAYLDLPFEHEVDSRFGASLRVHLCRGTMWLMTTCA